MITLQGITKVYDAGGEKISALEGGTRVSLLLPRRLTDIQD